jgi:ornithine cyclodeaminase/alanine dehydrogenase-like protein (mu-crystallin family)
MSMNGVVDREGGQFVFLDAAQVRSVLDADSLAAALRRALIAYSAGVTDTPARIAAHCSNGLLSAMPGFVPGVGIGAKVLSVFPGNPAVGKPGHQGLVVLFDEVDGRPLAAMDARSLTMLRTAAVSWLAIDHLAPSNALVVAVIGAGEQAYAHVAEGLRQRELKEVRIVDRSPERAEALAAEFPGLRLTASAEEAASGADVVICCTDSQSPVLRRGALEMGALVVSIGSGWEVDQDTVASCHLVVEWRGAITSKPPAGAEELQGLEPTAALELGELLGGGSRFVQDKNLTLFKSTGLAVEDVAAARLAFDVANARHIGRWVPWDG